MTYPKTSAQVVLQHALIWEKKGRRAKYDTTSIRAYQAHLALLANAGRTELKEPVNKYTQNHYNMS